MPCDTNLKPNQSLTARGVEIKRALTRLEAALTANQVKVKIGPNGAVALDGWKPDERDGVSDVCAIRTLTSENSWPLRQAIARAEAQQGRKVNPHAVAAGIHSHDGGKNWDKGH